MQQWLDLIDRVGHLQQDHAMNLLVMETLATFLPGRNEASAGAMMEALLPLQELTNPRHECAASAALDRESLVQITGERRNEDVLRPCGTISGAFLAEQRMTPFVLP